MKLILKHSFINIIRMPLRTALCFLIAFVAVVVSVVCTRIYTVTESAKADLTEKYPAVATVSVRQVVTPDGYQSYSGDYLNLDHVMTLIKSESVTAYNTSLYAGVLGEDEFMGALPNDLIFSSVPPERISTDEETVVTAVNNILLTEPFYSGDSVIISGELFNESDMRGGLRAIIISEQTADKYGVSAGDSLTLKFNGRSRYAVYHIAGIYKSKRGMTCAYIPLSDYFRDHTVFDPGTAYLDSGVNRLDSVFRLDFLLCSPGAAGKFIHDAIDNGFDTSDFDIAVNDMPYKTTLAGLEDITSISLIILLSVIFVGFAVFVLVAFFFSISRRQERSILRALGMKNSHISAMLGCELAIIVITAAISGVGIGCVSADAAVTVIEKSSLNEALEKANTKRVAGDAREGRSLTLQRNVDISLTDGYAGLSGFIYPENNMPQAGEDIIRYETFWTNEEKFTVTGVVALDADGFVNSTSYERSICEETHRMAAYSFRCYVKEGSSYKTGDVISIYAQNPDGSVNLVQNGDEFVYKSGANADIMLLIAGEYDSELYSGIVMPMKELELLCDYVGVSGNTYTSIRYDPVNGGQAND